MLLLLSSCQPEYWSNFWSEYLWIFVQLWGGHLGKGANQVTPGSSEKERPGWGGLLPWPLIQWWRWPSGLTHPGGLPWPAVAACSVLRPPRPHFHPGLLLPSLPPPPLLGKGRCFNEGGKEVFWQFRLFLSRRFVSQTQYSFSIPNSTLLIPSTVESGL